MVAAHTRLYLCLGERLCPHPGNTFPDVEESFLPDTNTGVCVCTTMPSQTDKDTHETPSQMFGQTSPATTSHCMSPQLRLGCEMSYPPIHPLVMGCFPSPWSYFKADYLADFLSEFFTRKTSLPLVSRQTCDCAACRRQVSILNAKHSIFQTDPNHLQEKTRMS